ncbi:MAG: MBL fold metallo-hydrolase [Candidatus Heimdallarchaeaceae archaeon]|jgi:glyoxylase-like metal-dependent hydrolase (beta-lactamase superfamily II)
MKIHVIRGTGLCSNCFILESETENKLLIVDLGLPGLLSGFSLKKAVDKITKKDKNFEIEVFLTHCHVDHVTGANNLKNYSNKIFSASEPATKHINTRDNVTLISRYKLKIPFIVSKTYKDDDTITIDNTQLRVIYAPGHTDGSAVLYETMGKNLFSGDVVFAGGGVGRMDFPTGSKQEMIQTLQKLSQLEINGLYCGHGEELFYNVRTNILDVKKMLEYW